jgi:hypothetical protein
MAKRVRGNLSPELIQGALRQGDNNVVQMFGGGSTTVGHAAVYASDGSIIDGGAAVTNIALKTNGTANGSQTILNLKNGTNITVSDDGLGGITITATGGVTLKTNGTANGSQSILNLKAGSNVTLADDGLGGVTIAAASGVALETNGTANGSQAVLNLKAGSNITLADDGLGGITITGASALTLKTNGTTNGSQTLLNLKAGTGISVVDDGAGGVTITNTATALALKTNGTANGSQSILNLKAGTGITLADDGLGGITITSTGSGITLKTNSVANGSQSILNLKAGSNVTLTDDGVGGVTIASTGGSSSGGSSYFTRTTPSRVAGTVYQNTTGKPLMVFVECNMTNSTAQTLTAWCDSSTTPTTAVAQHWYAGSGQWAVSVFFFVPVNYYYKVNGTSGVNVSTCVEVQMNLTLTPSSNLAGSTRALSTVYQNTTGNTIFVVAQMTGTSGNLNGYCDTTTTPSTVVWQMQNINGGTGPNTVIIPVPNGSYYKVVSTGTLSSWVEYQINVPAVQSTPSRAGYVTNGLVRCYQNPGTSTKAIFAVAANFRAATGTVTALADATGIAPFQGHTGYSQSSIGWTTCMLLALPGDYYTVYGDGSTGFSGMFWNEFSLG